MNDFARRSSISGLLIAGIGLVFWFWTRSILNEEHQRWVGRLQYTAGWLVERAHHRNDDLLIQETMQALGSAPGILFAVVTDSDRRVLAHSEPARFGQILHPSKPGTYTSDLREGGAAWGKLYLRVSGRGHQAALRAWGLLLIGGMGALWFLDFQQQLVKTRTIFRLREDVATLSTLAAEAERKCVEVETQAKDEGKRWNGWLQETLEAIREPVLFLDNNQRVVGANGRARQRWGNVTGCAWHEVQVLQDMGAALEESVVRAGLSVKGPTGETRLMISTLADRSGTWVRFEEEA